MKIRTVATIALLAFVAGSVAYLIAKESRRPSVVAASSAAPGGRAHVSGNGAAGASSGIARGTKVIAYYFHGNFRCASCVKIETLSRRAVTEGFPEDVRSGRVEFREVNVDEPQNRHFIEDYRLSSQSLVIVDVRDGRQARWRNMEKVWTLLNSERDFISYVRDGVSGFLRGA